METTVDTLQRLQYALPEKQYLEVKDFPVGYLENLFYAELQHGPQGTQVEKLLHDINSMLDNNSDELSNYIQFFQDTDVSGSPANKMASAGVGHLTELYKAYDSRNAVFPNAHRITFYGFDVHPAWGRESSMESFWAKRFLEGTLKSVLLRDQIFNEESGFTKAGYDCLTGPYRLLIGPVHPDD